jgi:hypothetical protein
MRPLLRDLITFVEILLYWPFVVLVMLPVKQVDRLLGTRLLPPLVRLTKFIGNL